VTRAIGVLFVCLCLQTSALSAPFVHLHADAAHESGHHDGRVVHHHVAAHPADNHAHHHDRDASPPAVGDDAWSAGGSTEPTALALDSMSARLSESGMAVAPPDQVVEVLAPPAAVTPPHDDVGHRPARPPDLGASSLRGPPR
jgi:hypothetical protein